MLYQVVSSELRVETNSSELLTSSHPEKTFPDENTQLLAIIYGQKPFEKGFLA